MLLICLFLASEARRVLLTLLGLDGMGLYMMMSMHGKTLLRYSQYHTKPTRAMHSVRDHYSSVRGRKLASEYMF